MTGECELKHDQVTNGAGKIHESDDCEEELVQDGPGGQYKLNSLIVPDLIAHNIAQIAVGENKKKKKKKKAKKKKPTQSDPPRTGLSKFFPDGRYPVGEIQEYKNEQVLNLHCLLVLLTLNPISNAYRTTSEEKSYLEKLAMEDPDETYENIRRSAEVHRLVRNHARKHIRPGMTMLEIVENIEDGTRALVEENGFESGIGFPTGVSLNECAAHYTPNAGDRTGEQFDSSVLFSLTSLVLKIGDVLKVDFGVHVKGRILDSAFTMTFEDTYNELLEAVKDATNTGIRVTIINTPPHG
jgi:methionyl aminopeptidase